MLSKLNSLASCTEHPAEPSADFHLRHVQCMQHLLLSEQFSHDCSRALVHCDCRVLMRVCNQETESYGLNGLHAASYSVSTQCVCMCTWGILTYNSDRMQHSQSPSNHGPSLKQDHAHNVTLQHFERCVSVIIYRPNNLCTKSLASQVS